MSDASWAERDRARVWHPFTQAGTAPPALVATRAAGAWIETADGGRYLDLVSSWWVTLHGHAHPAIAAAIARQAGELEQVIFADFTHRPAIELAERVCALLPGDLDRVFFSDDGSTAVEVALKMAVQYWRNHGRPDRTGIVAFEGGYHGDTVGAMSAGRGSGFFDAFRPLLFPAELLPFPATWDDDPDVAGKEAASLAALGRLLDRRGDTLAALIIEPLVQGAGGMRMCRPDFVAALVEMARAAGMLVVFDEVMTGFGRTGRAFACLAAGVVPDMICLSKGLTGGFLPLSMTVCREHVHQAFLGQTLERAFLHGHSFTANPLGCAAGLASLALLERAWPRLAAIEAVHRRRLTGLAGHRRVARTRLRGTIAAFDVTHEGAGGYGAEIGPAIKRACRSRGLLLRPLGDVVYLLPPYCVEDSELDLAYDVLEDVLGTL